MEVFTEMCLVCILSISDEFQGVFGTLIPNATLEILFLPMIQFSASTGIKGLIAMDTAGSKTRLT
jgi:hypothetical protein